MFGHDAAATATHLDIFDLRSNLGDVSAQELCSSKRGLLTGTSWNWHICPCTHESNSLDVNTANNASSRKVEEDKVTLCGVLSSCNVQK